MPAGELQGRRVQLHPATDAWMHGDKYGQVIRVRAAAPVAYVLMDASRRIRKVRLADIFEVLPVAVPGPLDIATALVAKAMELAEDDPRFLDEAQGAALTIAALYRNGDPAREPWLEAADRIERLYPQPEGP